MAKQADPTPSVRTPDPENPVPFTAVLRHELMEIERRRGRGSSAADPGQGTGKVPDATEGPCLPWAPLDEALKKRLLGLSLSGGGIRSATFNLGVLQALAKLGLLQRLDYLSTVSGGGYIGSWLSGLFHREGSGDEPPEVRKRVASRVADGDTVDFLRRYSNYLTPKVGLLSADTWAVVTTYLRNFLLNLVLLVVALGFVLLAVRQLVWVYQPAAGIGAGSVWASPYFLTAMVLALLAVTLVGFSLASLSREVRGTEGKRWWSLLEQRAVQTTVVLPLFVAALCGAWWLSQIPAGREGPFWSWALATALAYSLGWAAAWGVARVAGGPGMWQAAAVTPSPDTVSVARGGVRGWGSLWRFLAYPAAGAVMGLLLWKLQAVLAGWSEWQMLLWGPPLVLAWFVLLAMLHTGLAGRNLGEGHREWLSRLGAWVLIYALGWLGLVAASLYGPVLLVWAGAWLQIALASGWLATTLGGLLASRGAGAGGEVGPARALLLTVAPYVFIAGLVCLLSLGLDRTLSLLPWTDRGAELWQSFTESSEPAGGGPREVLTEERTTSEGVTRRVVTERSIGGEERPSYSETREAHLELLEATTGAPSSWVLLALLGAVFGILGWRVDVNEFSMHGLYRNRLVRAYLGASVPPRVRRRWRQPFTGFWDDDDISLAGLTGDAGPYHLVNTTLNLVGGEQLAWQERKAASFVFSPFFSGFDAESVAGAADGEADGTPAVGYRSNHGAGGLPGYGCDPRPLTLGTAMAVSGAAVSPNMGFRSSPALAFLLTVFNVRLGWWLGNPWHPSTWRDSGPGFASAYLLSELLGTARWDSRYVYLSDGGHFENLGVYELVRRRCRFIIASDAGADPGLAFDDLGNAIRKCRTDFGIDIEIEIDPLRRQGEDGPSTWHCVVGKIRYDRVHPDLGVGVLLYLKASLTGDEPGDVANYAAEHPEFPHQTTGDQWFDESQFESYRRLGEHVAHGALEKSVRAAEMVAVDEPFSVEQVFTSLRQGWYPPSQATTEAFTRQTEALEGLFEELRTNPRLQFLNEQFYIEWHAFTDRMERGERALWLPPSVEERREGFFFCNQLLQLMENVYLDLDLERQWQHPDNRGWINLFRHWSWSGMFRVTWAASASTYGARFQTFCWQRLGLELGQAQVAAVCPPAGSLWSSESWASALATSEDLQRLSFLERDLVASVLESGEAVDRVFVLQLAVGPPAFVRAEGRWWARPLYLCFGLALGHGTDLKLLRVRDHLRTMGLGRRALRKLVAPPHGVAGLSAQIVKSGVPGRYHRLFPEMARRRFLDLFESVRREWEESPRLRRGPQAAASERDLDRSPEVEPLASAEGPASHEKPVSKA